MNNLLKISTLLISVFILAACSTNSVIVRYKAILTLEVDGKLKEFSNVMQVKYTKFEKGQKITAQRRPVQEWGEALVIDLGRRGRAYMLPIVFFDAGKKGTSGLFTSAVINTVLGHSDVRRLIPEDFGKLENFKGRRNLKIRNNALPTFVYFDDENEPNSIHHLDARNLQIYFGSEVNYISLEIESTNLGVTKGEIFKYLPWLASKDSLGIEAPPIRPVVPRNKYKFKWHIGRGSFLLPETLNDNL